MVIYLPKANFGYSICTYKFISKIKHSCVRNTIIVEYTANDRRLQMHNSLCIMFKTMMEIHVLLVLNKMLTSVAWWNCNYSILYDISDIYMQYNYAYFLCYIHLTILNDNLICI